MSAMFGSFHFLLTLFVSLETLALAQQADKFIYNGFTGSNLSLSGFAKIHPNGLLELTNTSEQQIGHAFLPFPLHFNNSASSLSFSTSFVFAMVPDSRSFGGHGIAFTISPSLVFNGATGTQYLGLFNSSTVGLTSNHVVAIELDSVQNPEFGDINDNHIGIDVNSLRSIHSAPVTYYFRNGGENERLELVSGDPMQVWIDYHEVNKLLNVSISPITSEKPERPLLSEYVDLSAVFLDSMYVGFSSSTGSVASHHYILGWSFNRSGEAQSLDISKLPSFPQARKSRKKPDLRILLPFIAAVVLSAVIATTILIMRKRYEEIREDWEEQYGPQRLCYKDLYKATNGFGHQSQIGSGGFGEVYRGVLPSSNMEVAVKKVSHNSKQGMKEFVAEIASMGRLRHRNLVNLLGYCRRRGELFLVYDYMPNGSLDKFLFSNEGINLSWVQRYQILRGVASALLYLHEEWEQVVLHRDVKASNVLLDSDFNGRLGDFGLAKFYDHGSTPQTTCVVGTMGYLAPEINITGRATTCTDVFSFGIFMLEVASGRRPIEPQRQHEGRHEEVVLIEWVRNCWKRGEILRTSDPRLEANYAEEEMELVLKLGLLCTHNTPANRLSMRQVVQYLDGNATLPEFVLHPTGIVLVPGSGTYEATGENNLSFPLSTNNFSSSSSFDTESILRTGQ